MQIPDALDSRCPYRFKMIQDARCWLKMIQDARYRLNMQDADSDASIDSDASTHYKWVPMHRCIKRWPQRCLTTFASLDADTMGSLPLKIVPSPMQMGCPHNWKGSPFPWGLRFKMQMQWFRCCNDFLRFWVNHFSPPDARFWRRWRRRILNTMNEHYG